MFDLLLQVDIPNEQHSLPTCGGLGFDLLALPGSLLSPYMDGVLHTGSQACENGTALLLPHWNLPGLSISRCVAHHVPVNISLNRVPGDGGCIFCHLVGHQVFGAVNVYMEKS